MSNLRIESKKLILNSKGGNGKRSVPTAFKQIFLFSKISLKAFSCKDFLDSGESFFGVFVINNDDFVIEHIFKIKSRNVNCKRKQKNDQRRNDIRFPKWLSHFLGSRVGCIFRFYRLLF